MAYFGESSNLFYDRTCNNEVIKMQRLSPEHLQNMVGVEYVLLHVQVRLRIGVEGQTQTMALYPLTQLSKCTSQNLIFLVLFLSE